MSLSAQKQIIRQKISPNIPGLVKPTTNAAQQPKPSIKPTKKTSTTQSRPAAGKSGCGVCNRRKKRQG